MQNHGNTDQDHGTRGLQNAANNVQKMDFSSKMQQIARESAPDSKRNKNNQKNTIQKQIKQLCVTVPESAHRSSVAHVPSKELTYPPLECCSFRMPMSSSTTCPQTGF